MRLRKQPLRSARQRSPASARWLQRQLKDPYVAAARKAGYRSRAAFKLAELDDRFHVLQRGARVVDLGAAPGGWTQVAVERCGGQVLAVDLEPLPAPAGAQVLQLDLRAADAAARVSTALDGPADVVLSDMAPRFTGHAGTDRLRAAALAESAYEVARAVLAPGGAFLCKTLAGGGEAELVARLKRDFAKVRHVKPLASRKESSELYLVATGFRGTAAEAVD